MKHSCPTRRSSDLADINADGIRDRGAFVDERVRYHAAPRDLVNELVDERNWAPGDVYYACTLAQVVGRPCRSLVEVWGQVHDEGWEAVAGKAGIAKHPDATQHRKRTIHSRSARSGRTLDEVCVSLHQQERRAHASQLTSVTRHAHTTH